MKRPATGMMAALFVIVVCSAQTDIRPRPGDRPAANPHSTRSVVYGRNGMIATSQPLASAAGLRAMQDGGNAIDAAVTAAAVLAVDDRYRWRSLRDRVRRENTIAPRPQRERASGVRGDGRGVCSAKADAHSG